MSPKPPGRDFGANREPGTRGDSLQVITVVVACLAFLLASIAMGLSARSAASSDSSARAAQISLADASALKATGGGGAATTVGVTEHDFVITPATTSARAGLVNFTVQNTGPSQHEFLIFRTELAADKFPLGTDGRVNEDALDKVFDSENNLAAGTSQVFHTALLPGRYVLVCNLPGHYMAGMHTVFTVS